MRPGAEEDGSDSTENSSENNNSQNNTNTGENKITPRYYRWNEKKRLLKDAKINNNRLTSYFNEETTSRRKFFLMICIGVQEIKEKNPKASHSIRDGVRMWYYAA